MKSQSVIFTSEMMTVFVEHEKVIDRVLKRCHGLTTTEFCILRALYLAGGEVDGLDFAGFLMLKRNSISIALSSLARKNLVSKLPSEKDRRMLRVRETDEGIEITRNATASVYEAQTTTFWRHLTADEERGGNLVASLVLAKLRGVDYSSTAPLKETNTPITPEFIVFCKMVPQRWSYIIKKNSDLSLTDYRVLSCLIELGEEARASDVMRRLLLERSVVSMCKDDLRSHGLITESPDKSDRRNSNLGVTAKGHEVFSLLKDHLTTETSNMYSLCDNDLSRAVNEWHCTMYANLNISNPRV